MKLIIEDDEGRKTVVPFVREEITIGRQEGNTIRLTERNVSRRHARLSRQNGHVVVEDLGSYNGIRLNGEKIAAPAQVHDGDLIQIGDYDLAIQSEAEAPAPEPATELDHRTAPSDAVADEDTETGVNPDVQAAPPLRHGETAVIRLDQIEANRPRQVKTIEPEHAPRLVVLNTEFAAREFSCIRSELKIGRTEENDISLDHRSLSRTHAKLVREENGEWNIFDLRSANGLTVNGETYTKTSLTHGDVIELGHLKLRFIAPGKSYSYVAGDERPPTKKKMPVPLLAGIAAGVLLLAVIAFWALGGSGSEERGPTPIAVTTTSEPDEPAPAPEPAAVAEQPEPEPAVPDYSKQLATAQSAINARRFDDAVEVLEKLVDADGILVPEAQALIDEATAELAAKKAIAQAAKDVSAGRFDDAASLLDRAEGTVAFAADLATVRTRLTNAISAREAREAREAAAARARAAKANAKPVVAKEPPPKPANEARQYLDDGTVLFKKRQFREAKSLFQKCLEIDPKYARCHMMLGSTFAKLKDVEQGAKHYRLFVTLDPEDPDAQKVKRFLEEYEASKSN